MSLIQSLASGLRYVPLCVSASYRSSTLLRSHTYSIGDKSVRDVDVRLN
jgi:hypothetical protein